MEYPFFSVIIPTRNVEWCLERCLKSLVKIDYPKDKYEIIIADSDSEDKTREIAKKYGTIAVSGYPKTISGCRNKGFEIAKGKFIAFSDADCVFDKNWLKNSLKYFKNEKVAGVGGINITPEDETDFGKAVGFVLNQPLFTAGSVYARVLKEAKEVKSIAGCNAIYKREALKKVLPLDGNSLAEDYLMNQKVRELGYKIFYTPDTIVWHYRRPDPGKFFKQMKHYGFCRAKLGRENPKMINIIHILIGFGIPLLVVLVALSVYFNFFFYFLSFIILFLIFYGFLSFLKTKSLKTAIFTPYVIIIIFTGWSLGFLKQLFFTNENTNNQSSV